MKQEELAQIKQELRESNAKLQPLVAKKTAPLPSSAVGGGNKSPREDDDVKAKETVSAISAAFSSAAKAEEGAKPGPPTTPNAAAKPPASPSTGVARRPVGAPPISPMLAGKVKTSQLRNVPPTTLRKPVELQAECTLTAASPSSTTNTSSTVDLKRGIEEEDRKLLEEVPVLNLTTKLNQKLHVSDAVTPKAAERRPANPQTATLLASLQLPPSVSAKVDRIVSGSGGAVVTGGSRRKAVWGGGERGREGPQTQFSQPFINPFPLL